MAGDWIKFEMATPDKPEVVRMASVLKIDQDAVVGKLVRIWIWADINSVDGGSIPVTESFIDRLTNRKGFANAMRVAGWLRGEDGAITFPNFERHNGKTAKARAESNRRVAIHRASNTPSVGERTIPRALRTEVAQRDNHQCRYCGRMEGEYKIGETGDDGVMTIDHVIPLSSGGSGDAKNLVLACMPCNRSKSKRTPSEAGMKWPTDDSGNRFGVTSTLLKALPEKRREESNTSSAPKGPEGAQPKPPKPRNPLLDALAAVDGSDPLGITPSAWPGIGKALADIKTVSPDVTPEEIRRRAIHYRHHHKEATISAHALAKHWAKCARMPGTNPPPVPTTPKQQIPEPLGWRPFVASDMPESPYAPGQPKQDCDWSAVTDEHKRWIIEGMKKHGL